MTRIKICGVKTEEQALAAAEAGADFIGLMFADSPRQITPARAEKIVAFLKSKKSNVETVGVFVNAHTATVNRVAVKCGLDYVQLSGDEPWEYCREIARPFIKVIRVSRNRKPEQVCKDLAYGSKLLGEKKHIYHIDSNVPDRYGGTGRKFDWKLAVPIAREFPVIIAGGLTPENVGEAIKVISPWGVDVSSGVETKGVKDVKKIKKFIEAVREADERA
ncbi:MAG: phosphoribosylanthranilate isomerase [Dehalococcoidales bacterium]|nr:phosphoribosylanthranilate isomerase [Dehalococcoidales bacterium]